MAKSKREEKSVELANQILENYQPKTVEDMQNALKDIFGPMFEAMLKGEMDNHLGYESNDKNEKETDNRRNGYGKKTLKTSAGEVDVKVPRDRDGSFDPQLIPKRKKDVSAIENKVISMYARGMSQRDISTTIEEIYGFSVSHEMISDITDHVLPE
ncbi:transposase, partial [Bacillus norwichensis]